jgi:hypothetical protein
MYIIKFKSDNRNTHVDGSGKYDTGVSDYVDSPLHLLNFLRLSRAIHSCLTCRVVLNIRASASDPIADRDASDIYEIGGQRNNRATLSPLVFRDARVNDTIIVNL